MATKVSAAIAVLDEAGKAAFCLWLAGQVERSLVPEEAERLGITHAVAMLLSWGQGSTVSGDELSDLLLNTNDEGLFASIDPRQPRETDQAISAVGSVICFIAWIAYKNAGEHIPDGINQVDDEIISWAAGQAISAQAVREESCLSLIGELAAIDK